MIMKGRNLLLASVVVLILLCACQQIKTEETVTIGLITPQTGHLAVLGETTQRSSALALEEINAEGGINGKPLKILFEDSKAEIKTAVISANKLIEIEKVPVVIEVSTSGDASVIAPVAQKNKIIHYSVLATTESLTDAGEYVFKMREGAIPHTQAISKVMHKEDVESVAVLHRADEYCTNMIDKFAKTDIEIVCTETYQTDDTDMRSQIAKIKDCSAKGLYVCGFYEDLGLAFKQLHELNSDKKLFSVTTFEHPLVKKNAGAKAIEGTIYSVSPLDCSAAKGFCEKYKVRFGNLPDYRAAFVYDAVHIIAKALKKSSDPAEIKDILLTLEHDGATGKTRFDAKGNAIKNVVVHQVKDGEWVSYP